MLDIATSAAASAPTTLDEPALVGLLEDVLVAGFAQRSLAGQRVLADVRDAPAGEELLAVERAVRVIAVTIRDTPDETLLDKLEAIDLVWMSLTKAAADARSAVLAERERIIALEAAARLVERPVVGNRQFVIKKEAP
jgi:hypothetical protein